VKAYIVGNNIDGKSKKFIRTSVQSLSSENNIELLIFDPDLDKEQLEFKFDKHMNELGNDILSTFIYENILSNKFRKLKNR
jgi:methionyl-tRNA formyltransferase